MDSKLRCVFPLPPGQEQNNVEEKYEQGYDNVRSQVAATPAQSEVKVRFRLGNMVRVIYFVFLPTRSSTV